MTARILRRLLPVLALLASPALAAAEAGTPAATPAEGIAAGGKAADLSFLAGSWRLAGPPVIEEHWMPPAGGTLIGMGRVSSGEKTFFFEYLRIETRPDGLYYVAQPKGGPATAFKLVKLAPGEAVFENLQHDFPKRILYRRQDDGRLLARTEGDGTEKENPAEFLYDPVKD